MCGSLMWRMATVRASCVLSRFSGVARIEASTFRVVPVASGIELLSRTVRVAQVSQAEFCFVGFFLEQSRVVVVCVAEDVSQEPGIWFRGIGRARAGSEGISDATVEVSVLKEGTFCSSARRGWTRMKIRPWHRA